MYARRLYTCSACGVQTDRLQRHIDRKHTAFTVAHKRRIREETEAIYKRPTSQTTLTNFRLIKVKKDKDSTDNRSQQHLTTDNEQRDIDSGSDKDSEKKHQQRSVLQIPRIPGHITHETTYDRAKRARDLGYDVEQTGQDLEQFR